MTTTTEKKAPEPRLIWMMGGDGSIHSIDPRTQPEAPVALPAPPSGDVRTPRIADEAGWQRFCQRMRVLYGHLPAEERIFHAVREILSFGEDAVSRGDLQTAGRLHWILDRLERTWDDILAREAAPTRSAEVA